MTKRDSVFKYLLRHAKVEINGEVLFTKKNEEIAKALNTTVANVKYHLNELKKDKKITTRRKVVRMIKIYENT